VLRKFHEDKENNNADLVRREWWNIMGEFLLFVDDMAEAGVCF
jgi:hypothetical protein